MSYIICPEVKEYEGIIVNLSLKFLHQLPSMEREDVYQEAQIAALDAIKSYRAGLGATRVTYVYTCVKRALLRLIETNHPMSLSHYAVKSGKYKNLPLGSLDEPLYSDSPITAADMLVEPNPLDVDALVEREQYSNILRKHSGNLTTLQREVLRLYCIHGSLRKVSEHMNICHQTVTDHFKRAVKRLQRLAQEC